MPKKEWHISAYENQAKSCRLTDGSYVQYPVIHDGGGIAYDWPELVPKYIKEKVKIYLYGKTGREMELN